MISKESIRRFIPLIQAVARVEIHLLPHIFWVISPESLYDHHWEIFRRSVELGVHLGDFHVQEGHCLTAPVGSKIDGRVVYK